jgi:superfamily II DNA/RNA helicase
MQKLVIDEFDEMLNLGLEPNWPLSYDAKKASKHSFQQQWQMK